MILSSLQIGYIVTMIVNDETLHRFITSGTQVAKI